jgi:hypothetical protein
VPEWLLAALRQTADRFPLDEPLQAKSVLALAAAGHQAHALDAYRIVRTGRAGPGYLDSIDVYRFRRLVDRARRHLESGSPQRALSLWRGPTAAGTPPEKLAHPLSWIGRLGLDLIHRRVGYLTGWQAERFGFGVDARDCIRREPLLHGLAAGLVFGLVYSLRRCGDRIHPHRTTGPAGRVSTADLRLPPCPNRWPTEGGSDRAAGGQSEQVEVLVDGPHLVDADLVEPLAPLPVTPGSPMSWVSTPDPSCARPTRRRRSGSRTTSSPTSKTWNASAGSWNAPTATGSPTDRGTRDIETPETVDSRWPPVAYQVTAPAPAMPSRVALAGGQG